MPIYPEGRGPLDYMRRLARGLLPAFQCPEISPRHHAGPLVLLPSSALWTCLGREKRGKTPSVSSTRYTWGSSCTGSVPGPWLGNTPAGKGRWGGGGGHMLWADCRLPSAACRVVSGIPRDWTRPSQPFGCLYYECVSTNGPVSSQSANTHTNTVTHTLWGVAPSIPSLFLLRVVCPSISCC